MQNPRFYAQKLGFGQYPDEWDEDAPVPPSYPVPNCRCDVPAWVTQSRHKKTAGRAYYCCRMKFNLDHRKGVPCYFFQWIDGPDKYDPRIRLFPYNERSELKPHDEFSRWMTPPPNPPAMTTEEKQLAAIERVNNPPLCHCGVRAYLQRPNIGVPAKFTPFFRCSRKTLRGWPRCDFNEYIYGPRSHWPSEAQLREFESGEKPWPCETLPPTRCKCGIIATKGVVPSELGFGKFCGNAYGEYWEGRTCDWEDFLGRSDLMLELGRTSEPWKSRKTEEIRNEIRRKYGVPLPEDEDIDGCIYKEIVRETGWKMEFRVGNDNYEKILAYWRRNRDKFPRPLTVEEKIEKRERKKKEGWRDLQKMLRENRDGKANEEKRMSETQQMRERKKEEGWQEMQQWMRTTRGSEDILEKRIGKVNADLPTFAHGGHAEGAREAQLEAMKALVGDLPVQKADAKNKGKGILVDDWGEDEVLSDGDSD